MKILTELKLSPPGDGTESSLPPSIGLTVGAGNISEEPPLSQIAASSSAAPSALDSPPSIAPRPSPSPPSGTNAQELRDQIELLEKKITELEKSGSFQSVHREMILKELAALKIYMGKPSDGRDQIFDDKKKADYSKVNSGISSLNAKINLATNPADKQEIEALKARAEEIQKQLQAQLQNPETSDEYKGKLEKKINELAKLQVDDPDLSQITKGDVYDSNRSLDAMSQSAQPPPDLDDGSDPEAAIEASATPEPSAADDLSDLKIHNEREKLKRALNKREVDLRNYENLPNQCVCSSESPWLRLLTEMAKDFVTHNVNKGKPAYQEKVNSSKQRLESFDKKLKDPNTLNDKELKESAYSAAKRIKDAKAELEKLKNDNPKDQKAINNAKEKVELAEKIAKAEALQISSQVPANANSDVGSNLKTGVVNLLPGTFAQSIEYLRVSPETEKANKKVKELKEEWNKKYERGNVENLANRLSSTAEEEVAAKTGARTDPAAAGASSSSSASSPDGTPGPSSPTTSASRDDIPQVPPQPPTGLPQQPEALDPTNTPPPSQLSDSEFHTPASTPPNSPTTGTGGGIAPS